MEKYHYILRSFLSLALWLGSSLAVSAGAWNLSPGEGQLISSFDYSKASSAFIDIDFDDLPLSFTKTETRLFYEHGLSKHITIVANGAHQTIQFSTPQSQLNFSDFSDIELGLRYQIMRREGLAVALQGSYIIGGGPPNSILDLNGPQDSFEIRALWGQSKTFENYALFFDTQAAIRARKSGKLDKWHSDVTVGFKKDKYMLLGQVFYAKRPAFGEDGFIVPTQESAKLKASLVYEYKKNRFVQLGYQETVAGRDIIREKGVSVGTWLRY